MKKFYYMTPGGTRQGPLEYSVLLQMKQRKELPETTRICAEGADVWLPIGSAPIGSQPPSPTGNRILYTIFFLILGGSITLWEKRHPEYQSPQLTEHQKSVGKLASDNALAESKYEEATNSMKAGAYQAAVSQLDAAIALNPYDMRFLNARAEAMQKLGNHLGAAPDARSVDSLSKRVFPSPTQ